jgi:dephospho-CoA kinase
MPILGITGGIASGKSTFRKLLLQHIRAESFDADACVSELLDEDESVKQILEKIHPPHMEREEAGSRAAAELIYQDADKKRTLEAILHPIVRDRWLTKAQEA